jgi:hypothetical protein
MALEDKTNVLVTNYVRRQIPSLETSMRLYIQEELQNIEASIKKLSDASPQVADDEPDSKRRGMVRYAVSPWDPLGNGYTGLVVYNGSSWVQV